MSLSNQELSSAPALPPDLLQESLNTQKDNSEEVIIEEAAPEVYQNTFERQPLGTIFMGPSPLLEASLSSFSGNSSAKVWDEKTEEEYMARIRERATEKITTMLNEAREEAAKLRQEALEQGYAQGLAEAKTEVDEFRAELGASVGAVVEAIEGQSQNIFHRWREDLTTLTRQAVEKVLGFELSQEKAKVIENLFKEAVAKLEDRTSIVVKVHPDDEDIVGEIISSTQIKYPDLKAWAVKADATITPGGLLLESHDSLIDNRIESRYAVVKQVLDSLQLEASGV